MELIEGSETSANYNRTPGKYPKKYIQYSKHGESLCELVGQIKDLINFSSFLGLVLTHVTSENLYGHDVAGPRDVTCHHILVKIPLLFDAKTGSL